MRKPKLVSVRSWLDSSLSPLWLGEVGRVDHDRPQDNIERHLGSLVGRECEFRGVTLTRRFRYEVGGVEVTREEWETCEVGSRRQVTEQTPWSVCGVVERLERGVGPSWVLWIGGQPVEVGFSHPGKSHSYVRCGEHGSPSQVRMPV